MDDIANAQSGNGFDKMRTMLARAAEIRADEQRQLYDMLEEVRVRLNPLEHFAAEGRGRIPSLHDNLSAVQQRLGELPDRTEISVIAERLDEALARIDGQDSVLAQVITAMNTLGERIGRPLDALEARLDGVAGRFEGVSGRLDGLDDRLLHLHGRLDDLEAAIARAQGSVEALPAQLDVPAVQTQIEELSGGVQRRFDDGIGSMTARLEALTGRLESVSERMDAMAGRVDTVEDGMRTGLGTLSGTVEQGIDKLEGAVISRPDREEVARTLRSAQNESEKRITHQLDQALAAFAEVLLGQSTKGSAVRAGGRMASKKSLDGDYAEG